MDKWKIKKAVLPMSDKKEVTHKHMMATKAMHKLGDISSDIPDICLVYAEDGDDWIGHWVCGYGFFDVRFPKSTTRDLTEEEIKKYNGQNMAINNTPIGQFEILGY